MDGIVVDGETLVDESMLSGEAMPQPKSKGSEVSAGTVEVGGKGAIVTVTKVGSETALAQIIKLVQVVRALKAQTSAKSLDPPV